MSGGASPKRKGSNAQDHHDYILRMVPKHGHRKVARKLGLDPHAVWHYAARRGVRLGDIPGYVRTHELAKWAGVSQSYVHETAKRHGALLVVGNKRAGARSRAALVKQAWADNFVKAREARREADEAHAAGYLTVNQAAKLWKVGRSSIIRGLQDKGNLRRYLNDVRIVRGTGTSNGTIYINPHDAERVRSQLQAERDQAKRMIPSKVIALDTGARPQDVATLARRAGGRKLFYKGTLSTFVTPDVAEKLRRELAA